MQKKTNLLKPFIIITTDGYYLDVTLPMEATKNGATILQDLLKNPEFRDFFQDQDVFVLDRGFRSALGDLYKCGFRTEMRHFIEPGKKQLEWQQPIIQERLQNYVMQSR